MCIFSPRLQFQVRLVCLVRLLPVLASLLVLVVIIMPRNRGLGGGRFRVTDDTAVTIGAGVLVQAEHVTGLNTTKKKERSDETRKGHRRHPLVDGRVVSRVL
jgi:hypothetical protein